MQLLHLPCRDRSDHFVEHGEKIFSRIFFRSQCADGAIRHRRVARAIATGINPAMRHVAPRVADMGDARKRWLKRPATFLRFPAAPYAVEDGKGKAAQARNGRSGHSPPRRKLFRRRNKGRSTSGAGLRRAPAAVHVLALLSGTLVPSLRSLHAGSRRRNSLTPENAPVCRTQAR